MRNPRCETQHPGVTMHAIRDVRESGGSIRRPATPVPALVEGAGPLAAIGALLATVGALVAVVSLSAAKLLFALAIAAVAAGDWRKPLGRGAASLPGSDDVAVTDGKAGLRIPSGVLSPLRGLGQTRADRRDNGGREAPSPAGPDPCAPGGLIRPVPGHREEDG